MAGETMIFDAAHYQPDVWKRIKKIIASNRVGSAYLFSGPEGSGKEATALAMGRSVKLPKQCNSLRHLLIVFTICINAA